MADEIKTLLYKVCKATTIDELLSYEQDLPIAYNILADNLLEKQPMLNLKQLFKRKKVRYGIEIMPQVIGEVKPSEVKKTLKQYKDAKIIYKIIYG